MAVINADTPFGAVPMGTTSGSPWQSALRRYRADGSTAIFRGDKVVHTGTGVASTGVFGTGGAYHLVTVAVDNNANAVTDATILGLMVAPVVDRAIVETEHPGYAPASGTPDVLVVTAPDLLMLVQEDNDADPIEMADLGQINIDVTTTTGSTTTGIAAWELDSSTSVSATTGPVRLYELYTRADNIQGDATGAPGGGGATADNRPKWLVTWAHLDLYLRGTAADI